MRTCAQPEVLKQRTSNTDLLIYHIVAPLTNLFTPRDVQTIIDFSICKFWKVIAIRVGGLFLLPHGQNTVHDFLGGKRHAAYHLLFQWTPLLNLQRQDSTAIGRDPSKIGRKEPASFVHVHRRELESSKSSVSSTVVEFYARDGNDWTSHRSFKFDDVDLWNGWCNYYACVGMTWVLGIYIIGPTSWRDLKYETCLSAKREQSRLLHVQNFFGYTIGSSLSTRSVAALIESHSHSNTTTPTILLASSSLWVMNRWWRLYLKVLKLQYSIPYLYTYSFRIHLVILLLWQSGCETHYLNAWQMVKIEGLKTRPPIR